MIKCGIDNIDTADALIRGRRVALMTNPTGVDMRMRSTIDILNEKYRLTALLACEHGVRGSVPAGERVDGFTDERTGVSVYSCYGASTHPPEEALDAFDALVYDIQDAGARFYTFIYSLSDIMQDCARAGKSVTVLDRPNPLGGETVQGTMLGEAFTSFVGRFPMPTRYALTVGEFALWVRQYLHLDLDLTVVKMSGWKRLMHYGDTGLIFVPSSPNLPTPRAAEIYAGTCIFEGCNVSEGRGTALPFELIGAPFVDAFELSHRMNEKRLPGFYFREAYFCPTASKHAGQQCAGVQIHLLDPAVADSPLMGLTLMDEIRAMYPDKFEWTGSIDRLLGTDEYRLGKLNGPELIERDCEKLKAWQEQSREFHLY